jgi:hypothetical protein
MTQTIHNLFTRSHPSEEFKKIALEIAAKIASATGPL